MKPDYSGILADLLARRDKLNSAIQAIQELRSESRPVKTKPKTKQVHRPRGGVTIAAAAIEFIKKSGEPQLTSDIAQALKAGGLGSNSKSLYRTVYNSLVARMKTQKDITKSGSKWTLPVSK